MGVRGVWSCVWGVCVVMCGCERGVVMCVVCVGVGGVWLCVGVGVIMCGCGRGVGVWRSLCV